MKASVWWRGGILVSGILFLAACSENVDLFSSLDEQEEPELSTVQAGAMMTEDGVLEVQIEYPTDESSRATSMRVELRDTEGTVHDSAEFDQAQLAEPFLRAVKFSEPPEGVYVLVTEAWINDQILVSDRRQVFVTDIPPRIESVTIHPTTIRREMQALAVAELDYSTSTRPYMRWIFDGEVAAEGYLEDGLDRAILDGAGRSSGAYRVFLEVYPWGVEEGTVIDGSTTITADSDVVVREELQPSPPDLSQRRDGTVLRFFSFDGTRQAWTDSGDETLEAAVAGDVYLDMVSGALGVRVTSSGTVSAPLPVPAGSDVAHLVELRVSATGSSDSFTDGPVISFAGADDVGEGVSISLERGSFLLSSPGSAPAVLADAPHDRELVTLRMLVRYGDGDIFLEPAMNGADGIAPMEVGHASQDLSVTVEGQGDREMFLDRVIVRAVTEAELQQERADRAAHQFFQSFNENLGGWASASPAGWGNAPAASEDYPYPGESLSISADDPQRVTALLPDAGALVFESGDESRESVRLTRRGTFIELTSAAAPEEQLSRVEISGSPSDLFSLQRLELHRASAADGRAPASSLRLNQDDQGEFISVYLPESFEAGEVMVVPEARDAEYPIWVGRWAR